MRDIATIPIPELEEDLRESLIDIEVCETALLRGVTTYSGGQVQDRLNTNKHFVEVITEELEHRRKHEHIRYN